MFRGYLADIDCRWPVISGSVDDRTDEERGKKVSYNPSAKPAKALSFRLQIISFILIIKFNQVPRQCF